MSRYNKNVRSRSRERYSDNYFERNKNENINNEIEEQKYKRRELEFERRIENINEEKKLKEKEWEAQKLDFLKRENDLLREINSLKNQNNFYNRKIPKKFHFQRYNHFKYNKPFYQRQAKYEPFDKNKYSQYNQRNEYLQSNQDNQEKNLIDKNDNILKKDEKKEEKPTSELDKLISNLSERKFDDNNRGKTPFKNRIYLPNNPEINYVGLLLGPKGIFLKLLEKQSGCKIYIKGSSIGKRERYITPNDDTKKYVVILSFSQEQLKRGTKLIEDIINSDEETRNKIINEQLKVSKNEGLESLNLGLKKDELKSDDHLMTSNGSPGKNARYYKVPNDCIDSIIGKNGQTLKNIALESNCKVEIAKAPIPNSKLRYVFIEGSEENYEIAKELIEKIIGDYVNMNLK